MKNLFRTAVAFAIVLGFTQCTDDDDSTPAGNTKLTANEEELITTVNVILTDTSATPNQVDTVIFSDPDGNGGNAPTIGTIRLRLGVNYNVSLQFLDESDPNNVEDITAEIQLEDDEHLICFDQTVDIQGLMIQRTDSDGTYEVGLESYWSVSTTAASTSGSELKLTLKHQPGVKDGSCAPGDTDVEIDFPVIIQ